MKASVRVRETEQPLVRAKLPLDVVAGFPLFAGVSVGKPQELALHLGFSLKVGVSCRISYRPNDADKPFGFTLKRSFHGWISSSAEGLLSIAAEFDLSRRGCAAFRLWMKPRVGDYSLRRSLDSVRDDVRGGCCVGDFRGGLIELKEVSEGGRTVKLDQGQSSNSPVSVNDGGDGRLPGGRADQPLWGFNYAENETEFSGSNFTPDTTCQQRIDPIDQETRRLAAINRCDSPSCGSRRHSLFPAQDASRELGFPTCPTSFSNQTHAHAETPRNTFKKSVSGWSLRAHTSLPVGRKVMARIRWSVDLPSEFLESLEAQPFSLLKMPILSMDKVTMEGMEGMDRSKRPRRPMYSKNESGDMRYKNTTQERPEQNQEFERVASICSSMKQQLYLLHAENTVLMENMTDLRENLKHGVRESGASETAVKDHYTEDENCLYLRFFGELLAARDNPSKDESPSNIRRLKHGREDLKQNDNEGVRLEGGTSHDHASKIQEELGKAMIELNGNRFRRK